ncbi:hypothetical protein BK748_08835 [Bacillus thuringiensis serovar graciosensis]|nr:hypothetical protein BK748_08835 [Bacillus thuringiensis serovar graciosensis]PEU91298.1 WYL domain-containing protein [Bacillus cereus]
MLPSYEEEFQNKTNRVLIDYSPWDGIEHLRPKLKVLDEALDGYVLVNFTYSDAKGEVYKRIVELHMLILKGREWYLQAYCLEKEAFRLFKLKRMKELVISRERIFIRRDATTQEHIKSESKSKPSNVPEVLLRFQDEARHLAEEWFDIEVFLPLEDGSWLIKKAYPENIN